MAPKPPHARHAPAKPWRSSITRAARGPREPPSPTRSSRPGEAVALLGNACGPGAPRGAQAARDAASLHPSPGQARSVRPIRVRAGRQSLGAARSRSESGRFRRVRPEVVVAVVLRQPGWNLLAMEEVAHDPIGNRPVISIHAVVMRTKGGVPR